MYRLGNLALLEATANRNVGNSGYEMKVQAYASSNYDSTKSIASVAPEEWTPELLHERQRQMALRAEHLWRSDFIEG